MDNFTFYSPTYFVFGRGEENHTGKYVKRFGGSKVLIHYGGGSVVRSGLLDRVKASLEQENISYVELGGVRPNPRSGLVYQGIELRRKENVDFILAVGGGSTIDSSKAIAAGTVYDGDFWDFYQGKPVETALPVGTVLTIAAAGSEGSPDSVITLEDGMLKRGATGEGLRPRFSILNPERTAREGIEAFKKFLKGIGMPGNFKELGAREEDIPAMAHSVCYGNGGNGTVGGFVKLKEEDVAEIYRLVL